MLWGHSCAGWSSFLYRISSYLWRGSGNLPVIISSLRSHGNRHRSVLRFRIQHLLSVQLFLWLQQTLHFLIQIVPAPPQLLPAHSQLLLALALLGFPNSYRLPVIPCQKQTMWLSSDNQRFVCFVAFTRYSLLVTLQKFECLDQWQTYQRDRTSASL